MDYDEYPVEVSDDGRELITDDGRRFKLDWTSRPKTDEQLAVNTYMAEYTFGCAGQFDDPDKKPLLRLPKRPKLGVA
jgi:hypothetical protein